MNGEYIRNLFKIYNIPISLKLFQKQFPKKETI